MCVCVGGGVAAVNSSQGFCVWETPVGGLLRLGSSFSRIGAQPLRGHLYDVILTGPGRGICDQAEPMGFSLLGIQHAGERLNSWGAIAVVFVKFYRAPSKCPMLF